MKLAYARMSDGYLLVSWKYLQGMLHVMVEAAMPMLTSWENITGEEGGNAEIVVDESLRNFSADVISRTSFGSNFAAGKEIFNKIWQLQIAMAAQSMLGVTGVRYVEEINLVTVSCPKGLVFVCLLLMLTHTTAALALILESQTWNFEMQKVMFRASYTANKLYKSVISLCE